MANSHQHSPSFSLVLSPLCMMRRFYTAVENKGERDEYTSISGEGQSWRNKKIAEDVTTQRRTRVRLQS